MAGKERSPNYPGLTLEAAIQAIRQVYARERRSVAPTKSVAEALGHEALSGPALTKLAALRQYGLLEDVASGRVKVSDAAMPILLRQPEDPEYAAGLRAIALRPPLLTELFSQYPEASDATLRYHLITDRGFSEEGATRVIKIFRANYAFAKLDSKSYDELKAGPQEREPVVSGGWKREAAGTINTLPEELRRQFEPYMPRGPEEVKAVAYSWPLGDGNKVELAFVSEPTQRQLDVMMAQLKIMRDVAPTLTTRQRQATDDSRSTLRDDDLEIDPTTGMPAD